MGLEGYDSCVELDGITYQREVRNKLRKLGK